jgi:tyrosyl-tRNA synthetase
MEAKKGLAAELTAKYYDADAAKRAAEHFSKVHQQQETPEEIPEFKFPPAPDGKAWLPRILVDAGLVKSSSEGRRMMSQGAVYVNNQKIEDPDSSLPSSGDYIIKVGKRRFAKIIFS